jgi:2,4-dienoyl-CoA reductase-like NADH-dependent reductase (Old Yellow Enzyme family)
MIVLEPARFTPPAHPVAHLGIYADVQIPALHACLTAIQYEGCVALVMLDQPWTSSDDLDLIAEAIILAAWRARAAGAEGIMLSTVDGGPFQRLFEPGQGEVRLTALLHVIETLAGWLGKRCLIGVRLAIEEQVAGGMTLQDARVVARRLTSVGVQLIEMVVRVGGSAPVAQFPGWCTPLSSAIRAVVEVPVLVGGQLDDPQLAEQALLDRSADLIAVGDRLRLEPRWPAHASAILEAPNP